MEFSMKHVAYLTALLLVCAFSVNAQQTGFTGAGDQQVITLRQAISLALERNYQVTRSSARVDSDKSRVLSAYGNFLPNLSLNGVLRHVDSKGIRYFEGTPIGTFTTVNKTYNTGAGGNVTLFDGFANFGNLNQARYTQSSSELTLEGTRRMVTTRVYTLYFDVFRRQELLRVSQENLRRSRAQLERIVESNRVGAVAIVDVYRQQVVVGNDELAIIQAEQNLENAKAELTFFLGLNPVIEYSFDPEGVPTAISEDEVDNVLAQYRDFDQLQQQSLRNRPDIEAAQHRVYAAESGITTARGSFWPALTFSAGYGYTGETIRNIDDSRSFNYSLQLSIPVFQKFQRNNQVQQAKVQLKQAEIEHNELRNQALLDIRKAYLDLEAAAKSVEVTKQNIVAAREEQRLAEERYNLGAGTLLDLIIANTSLVQAESNNIDAIYGFHLAIRQLEYLIGEELY
jgi:outer membrane protein